MMTYFRWAKSEREAADLQALGWRVNESQPITHHHRYSILVHWEGEGKPPEVERDHD